MQTRLPSHYRTYLQSLCIKFIHPACLLQILPTCKNVWSSLSGSALEQLCTCIYSADNGIMRLQTSAHGQSNLPGEGFI